MRILPTELTRENDPDYEYIPDPLGRLGRGIWRRRRKFDPFGRIGTDPDFETFREGFDLAKPLGGLFPGRTPDLVAPVGRAGENERFDVALIETLLAKTGFFDLARTEGPTGYFGMDLDDAIRRFQKAANLKVDGLVNPGGPTLSALRTKFAATEDAERGKDADDDKVSEDGARKPVDLLEEAMRRGKRGGGLPPAPGDILDEGFPGGAGGARGRKPLPPPVAPGGDTGRSGPGRRPPAEAEADPDSDAARREALADEFVEELMKPLESHRGDATTKKGNDIVARECRAVLREDYPDLADDIKHVHGATKEGSGREEDKLPEKYVPNKKRADQGLDARPGSSHPDLTWQDERKKKEDSEAFVHANTATMKKKGDEAIARERDSYERLVENVGEELANQLPKLRPGMDEEKYRRDVRAKCQKIFEKWLGKPRKGARDDDENGLPAP